MKTLGSRLKNRRKNLKLTQKELADFIGVSAVSVTLWEKEETSPKGKNLHALCHILQCEPQWLLYGESTNPLEIIHSKRKYPLINWAQACIWPEIKDLSNTKYYSCLVNCSDLTFILRIKGISMQPIFNNDELIFVDPKSKIVNEKYVVVMLEGREEALIKQLIIEDDKRILKAANPHWPEQLIWMDNSCAIIGVVVFACKIF